MSREEQKVRGMILNLLIDGVGMSESRIEQEVYSHLWKTDLVKPMLKRLLKKKDVFKYEKNGERYWRATSTL